jgi:sugar-phosphatase
VSGPSTGARAAEDAPRLVLRADALLFDLDGVLVDSTASVERQWRRWAAKHGIDGDMLLRVVHGRRAADTIRDVAPWLDAEREVREDLAPAEAADVEGNVAIPGAAALLASLPAERWAVVTSCVPAVAEGRLQSVGLPVPRVLVTAADVARGKPDPEGYRLGAARLGVAAERCVVFEDAPAGLAAARAAGARAVGVATTHAAEELEADVVVRSLDDVRSRAGAEGVTLEVVR